MDIPLEIVLQIPTDTKPFEVWLVLNGFDINKKDAIIFGTIFKSKRNSFFYLDGMKFNNEKALAAHNGITYKTTTNRKIVLSGYANILLNNFIERREAGEPADCDDNL